MTKPVSYNQWTQKVGNTRGQVFWRTGAGPDQYKWLEGNVATPHGLVGVCSYPPRDFDKDGAVNLRFVYKGRLYERMYKKFMTELGAVRKAREFANEIAGS